MTLEIAPVATADLPAIRAIDAAVYPTPWSRRLWQQELTRPHRLYRCARWEGRVVGVIGVLLVEEDAHIMTVAVEPAAQRRGVATALMLDAARQVIDRGATALTLEVRASNTAAQALYQRFGLAPVGHRRGYYEPDGEDAVVMWARGIDSDDYRGRLHMIAEQTGLAA